MAADNRRKDRPSFRDAPKEFDEVLLQVARVTKVTAGGRQLGFRASIVLGNRKGKIGLGVGKASEVVHAVEKATRQAKKNMVDVPLVGGTVPYETTAKLKRAILFLHPAKPGTGIIAGGSARRILELAGYTDVVAKCHGSKNPLANAYVTFIALEQLKLKANPFLASKAKAAAVAAPAPKAA